MARILFEFFLEANTYEALGGIVTGGSAITSVEITNWIYTASGEVVLSGTALTVPSGTFIYLPSGGATLDGAAVTEYIPNYAYVASGGILTSGAADTALGEVIYIASGGAVLAGAALTESLSKYEYVAAGSIEISGNALYSFLRDFQPLPAGRIEIRGAARYALGNVYESSGSLVITGEALTEFRKYRAFRFELVTDNPPFFDGEQGYSSLPSEREAVLDGPVTTIEIGDNDAIRELVAYGPVTTVASGDSNIAARSISNNGRTRKSEVLDAPVAASIVGAISDVQSSEGLESKTKKDKLGNSKTEKELVLTP